MASRRGIEEICSESCARSGRAIPDRQVVQDLVSADPEILVNADPKTGYSKNTYQLGIRISWGIRVIHTSRSERRPRVLAVSHADRLRARRVPNDTRTEQYLLVRYCRVDVDNNNGKRW